MAEFEAAGVVVFALSYDEPDALSDFASAHDITYTLLSDPESELIRSFGILNTLIPEDDHPWFGIPFPGTYIVDVDGVIVSKFFEESLAIRPGPEQLLRATLGEHVDLEVSAGAVDEVEVVASVDGPHLAPGLTRELVVEFRVPQGHHLYGNPVPPGMIATSIELDETDGLIAFEPTFPPTARHVLASGEVLQIYAGTLRLRVPITVTGELTSSGDESQTVVVSGTAHFQTCDDVACSLPQHVRFQTSVAVAPVIVGDFGRPHQRTLPMNGLDHLRKMTSRRQR